ncbi:MAG: zinc-dependent peptidase [Bacteroidia bacterium]|nr:zinc-dependent peptidase [Bacteroidia bacterium]
MLFAGSVVAQFPPTWQTLAGALGGGFLLGGVIYAFFTRKYQTRDKIELADFPQKWRGMLASRVPFYNALDPAEKIKFENEIQVFLHEVRITGIRTSIDDEIRLLVASSAVIPIFGFPEWEYADLGEILIYPENFDADFQMGSGKRVLGMVGSGGAMERVMILSKPALEHGFQDARDKKNVAVHEFAHLIDKADGSIDGVPRAWLDPEWIRPWEKLMEQKMAEIVAGNSDINPYGATAPQEFFAVVSEYFFEAPQILQDRHPQLYALLERIFHQDTRSRYARAAREMFRPYGARIGRNAPCPCGSGKKYKQCCLG